MRAEKLTSYDELFMGGRGSGMADGSVTLDLRDGQTQEIALEMPDSNLGRLVGTIVDEAGAGSGYMMILVRELQPGRGARQSKRQSHLWQFPLGHGRRGRRLRFPAVREGTYRIYAIPRGRSIMPKNSVASESIQIFGNATARRDLFGRSGPIRGKVQRPNGQPFANCNVAAIVNGSRGPSSALPAGTRFTARTRGDGTFDFGRLPGGAYDVVIENTQYPKKIVGVEVYGSNPESLAITMEQQGRPSGKFNVNSK